MLMYELFIITALVSASIAAGLTYLFHKIRWHYYIEERKDWLRDHNIRFKNDFR
jgi:hypothetical protein